MARLAYLNDPMHGQEFAAAHTVWATREGRRVLVYGPLEEVKPPSYKVASAYPLMDVPIDGRGELDALLADCREIKGGCIYGALAEYDRLWSSNEPRS